MHQKVAPVLSSALTVFDGPAEQCLPQLEVS